MSPNNVNAKARGYLDKLLDFKWTTFDFPFISYRSWQNCLRVVKDSWKAYKVAHCESWVKKFSRLLNKLCLRLFVHSIWFYLCAIVNFPFLAYTAWQPCPRVVNYCWKANKVTDFISLVRILSRWLVKLYLKTVWSPCIILRKITRK